jgi:hypothetical protein
MKKLILLISLIFIMGSAFGQSFQKGNLLGVHTMKITLQPGVTMEKFMDFYTSKVMPEYERCFPGMKATLIKSLRGENKDSFGGIMFFKTEADRDKYFKPDGSYTDLGNAADQKLKPIYDEMTKLGTVTSIYNDWLVL